MNYKTCLILALIALTGCSTMHSTADHGDQPLVPASSASTTMVAARPAKEAIEPQPPEQRDSPVEHDDAGQARQIKQDSRSDTSAATEMKPRDTAPQTTSAVADESMTKPSVASRQKTEPLERTAASADSPSMPEPVAKSKPVEPKPARTKATAKPRIQAGHKPATKPAQLAITGSLQLATSGGQQTSSTDYANTVIYFVPDKGHARPRPGKFTVYTSHRDFSPAWLVVPLGSEVTFTNLDTVKHNVFSVTPGSQFDLGYQSANQSITHVFNRAGLVLLSCQVHRAMRGDVLVVPSRYATAARSNGRFVIHDVPDVTGTLYFWNPRSARGISIKMQPPFAPVQQKILLSRPGVTSKIGIGEQT